MHITRDIYVSDTLQSRFNEKIKVAPSGCIEWIAAANPDGYGQIFTHKTQGRIVTALAHRVAWVLKHGQIPTGMLVCHTCDNPSCVNADHLFLGTNLDNMKDMVAKGRMPHLTAAFAAKTRCPRGHEYAGDNLQRFKNVRMCRTCKRNQTRESHQRQADRLRLAAVSGEYIPATAEMIEIARVHEGAIRNNVSTYRAIGDEFGLTNDQIYRRIRKCKAAGLIPVLDERWARTCG